MRVVVILVLIAAIIIGWWAWPAEPIEVVVVRVEVGRVDKTVTNTRAGTVRAVRRAKVAPRTSGQVVELDVKEGDHVEKGTLLLGLWNDDLEAQVALAQAGISIAQARHEESCRNTEYYTREADRLEQLVKDGNETEIAADLARTRARAGEANCQATLEEVNRAEAQLALARANLEQTRLVAPFAGVVAEVNCELGEVVAPSPPGIPTPPAVELIDPTAPYVSAPIDEIDAPRVEVGMPARISLDARPGESFPGRVRRIAPYVLDLEKQARTVEIEVSFDAPESISGLLPGYSADAEVLIDAHDATLRIPTECVIDGNRVYVLSSGGEIEERKIEVGLTSWEYTEIVQGLRADESVIVSWQREGVEPGAPATPRPKSPKSPTR